MSRIGKLPIKLPEGVSVKIENRRILIKGVKGELEKILPKEIDVEIKDSVINLTVKSKSKSVKALHGTYRALIFNMVKGVNEGWKKELEIVGTGYRALVEGRDLVLTVGYSHPVTIQAPEGISFKVEKMIITVEGIDKELVGLISAKIRAVRPPEPYKGKGIKYLNEEIRRKAGKAAKAQGVTQ